MQKDSPTEASAENPSHTILAAAERTAIIKALPPDTLPSALAAEKALNSSELPASLSARLQ